MVSQSICDIYFLLFIHKKLHLKEQQIPINKVWKGWKSTCSNVRKHKHYSCRGAQQSQLQVKSMRTELWMYDIHYLLMLLKFRFCMA